MDLQLQDRTAIIGGASKGIGKAIALGLAQEGANVILSTFGAGFSWGATYLKWGMSNFD